MDENTTPRSSRRRRKNNAVRIILIVLCIILLCVFAYSGYKIISTVLGYKQAEKAYNEVANQYATVVASPTPVPEESDKPQGDGIDPEGMHAGLYMVTAAFGVRLYSCMLYLGCVHIQVYII